MDKEMFNLINLIAKEDDTQVIELRRFLGLARSRLGLDEEYIIKWCVRQMLAKNITQTIFGGRCFISLT